MNAPLRILLTADPMLPVPPVLYGGIERVIAEMITAFRARGHHVGLVAHRDSALPVDALYPWPNEAARGWRDHVANIGTLARAVRDFRPTLLHSFSRLAYLAPQFPTRLPLAMSYQRLPTPRTVGWSARLAPRLRFTGCSAFIAALGRRAGGQWIDIPNCVDASRYDAVTRVADDAPLVFLSRLDRIKGAHGAIAIARRSGRRLVIAGNRATAGDDARYFDDEIAPHVDGDRVQYIGPVDDARKNALLGGAAAMLLPIEWDEPFGIVMIEALACGTPVIANARGAVPEVVRDGVDGFVVDGVDSAVAAVAKLGTIDRAQCRARVDALFDVPRVADRYEALYRDMVGAR